MNLQKLIDQGENKCVEFKEQLPKNENIVKTIIAFSNLFKELGLIEQWGSGIARIKKSCLDMGLKEPKIIEMNDYVEFFSFHLSEVECIREFQSHNQTLQTAKYRYAFPLRRVGTRGGSVCSKR